MTPDELNLASTLVSRVGTDTSERADNLIDRLAREISSQDTDWL